MEYITTTDLRTKTTHLVSILKKNGEIKLIHRSKVIGIIQPFIEAKPFDPKAFKRVVNDLNLPKTTYAQREKRYRNHLEKINLVVREALEESRRGKTRKISTKKELDEYIKDVEKSAL